VGEAEGASAQPASDTKQTVQRLIPQSVIESAKAVVPARLWDSVTRRVLYTPGAIQRSRAFCVPNDYSGAIRVNLQGREPDGKVSPGREFDELIRDLTEGLLELEDANTGRKVIRDVVMVSNKCSGENLAALPDLLVLWANEAPIQSVQSGRIGRIDKVSPEQRTGAHRSRGILVGAGPHLSPDSVRPSAQILDLAPTLLNLLDAPVPSHFDGRSWLR
jgi:predicted AlkP superfamily phosphohydrolase/phosphomutase